MTYLVLRCGTDAPLPASLPKDAQVHDLSAIPTRQELKVMDALAAEILPEDPTPSLDEIAAQPDVSHLGTPQLAPQPVPEPLRTVVVGTDAALSAVLTRAMRADYMWVEFGFVPIQLAGAPSSPAPASTAAHNWGLPTDAEAAWSVALTAPVRPVPLIRNDSGLAIAGSAAICSWDGGEITGEIIVDDAVLVRQEAGAGAWGTRLVPMLDAPGIVAATALGPLYGEPPAPKGFLARLRNRHTPEPGALDHESVHTGRAVQAGGAEMRIVVDGVSAKRPVDRVTFYRHLRDLQIARP